jgi:RNA polymerase sigma-70 factor (ECF subfamily)
MAMAMKSNFLMNELVSGYMINTSEIYDENRIDSRENHPPGPSRAKGAYTSEFLHYRQFLPSFTNAKFVNCIFLLNYSSHSMDEQELISLAKQGDRMALSRLVKQYEQTVYNFAFKICRNKEKAENTMQETFLSMIKGLPNFDGNSKLSTWLYRIVTNHCLMEARKSNHYQFVEIETEDSLFDEKYLSDTRALPNKQFETAELRGILDEAIAKLEPKYRLVFLLRDVEQQSAKETAAITGLSVAAVKSRLHRARAFLRNELVKALN